MKITNDMSINASKAHEEGKKNNYLYDYTHSDDL